MLLFSALIMSCSKSGDDTTSGDSTTGGDSGSTDDGGSSGDGTTSDVYFTASIDTLTRTSSKMLEYADVDQITAIKGSESKEYTLGISNSRFTSTSAFAIDGFDSYTYTAVYPSNSSAFAGATYSFTAAADQSAGCISSDLIVGTSSSTARFAVELQFVHAMSSVVISVTNDAYEGLSSPTLSLNALATTVYTYADGTSVGTGDASELVSYSMGSGEYATIIAPQDGAISASYIDENGGATTAQIENFGDGFEAGVQYFYDWDIKTNTVTLISATIQDWAGGTGAITTIEKDEDEDWLPTPSIVSHQSGSFRAQITITTPANDNRIDKFNVTVDGAAHSDVTLVEETSTGYVLELGSLPTMGVGIESAVTVTLGSSSDASLVSVTSASYNIFGVYDVATFDVSDSELRTMFHEAYDDDAAYLAWTYDAIIEELGTTFDIDYAGLEETISVDATAANIRQTLPGAVKGTELSFTYYGTATYSRYEDDDEGNTTLVEYEGLDQPTRVLTHTVGTFESEYSKEISGSLIDKTNFAEAVLKTDLPTYTSAFGQILNTWNGTYLLTSSTSSSVEGYHTTGGWQGGTATFDLGAEYEITCYAYWQRRYSVIYASHANKTNFRIWGAPASAMEDGEFKEEYNKTIEGSETLPDLSAWTLLVEEEGLEAPTDDDTTYLLYFGSSGYTAAQLEALRGHYYNVTAGATVRYIVIELLTPGNGGTEFTFAELDFWAK